QLEEFGDLQKRFTSDVSHELRTPLGPVRMAADVRSGATEDLDAPTRRAVELLESELDRFESLLTDLLEVSRHDAGVAELSVGDIDVRRCVEDAVSTVSHIAESAGVRVEVDMPDEPIVGEVDSRRVERILRNLVANALDHSESKPVRVSVRGSEAALAVSVRDFGVGLRPGEEKLVFNRFWRADPSRVRRSGGTGLGLAISMEDARLHNGKLEAAGSAGKGAVFRLTLPRVRGRGVTSYPIPLRVHASPRAVESGPDSESGAGIESGSAGEPSDAVPAGEGASNGGAGVEGGGAGGPASGGPDANGQGSGDCRDTTAADPHGPIADDREKGEDGVDGEDGAVVDGDGSAAVDEDESEARK